jgi:hypothetical protein
MRPKTKIHLFSLILCSVLVGLNWFRVVSFSRKIGQLSDGTGPFLFAYFIAAAVALILALSCIRLCRSTLCRGTKWVTEWVPFLFALPLLYRTQAGSTWIEPDGATARQVWGYGVTDGLFWLAVIAIALFQARLVALDIWMRSNQSTDPTLSSVTSRARHEPRHP